MARCRYKGRYEKRSAHLKKGSRRCTLMLSIVLLLSLAVGGTLAYIAAKTDNVENQFERAYVTCRVNVSDSKDMIDITNTGNVDAYIRAAIIVNWMDSDGNVRGLAPTTSDYTLGINTTDWQQDTTTNFYYYKPVVAPDGTTNALVTSITVTGTVPEGYELSVEVVAEAIQADGDTDDGSVPAFQDAWGITLYAN